MRARKQIKMIELTAERILQVGNCSSLMKKQCDYYILKNTVSYTVKRYNIHI
jgi:hypothetical protein